jgi:hypothetical protein
MIIPRAATVRSLKNSMVFFSFNYCEYFSEVLHKVHMEHVGLMVLSLMSCLMHSVSIVLSNRLEICTIVFRFLNLAAEQQTLITNTMRRIEQETAINNRQCVRFRPKVSTDEYSILIQTGVGCSSHVCRYHFDI